MLVFIKVLLFVSIPMYAFFRVFWDFAKGKSVKIKAIDVYASMIIYCLFMLGFFLNGMAAGAGERLLIFERTGVKNNGYASLANEYVVSVIVLVTLGMISFWIVSLTYGDLPPLVYVVCGTLMILNIIFAVAYLTHTAFSSYGEEYSVFLLQTSFLSLFFIYIASLKDSLNHFLDSQNEKEIKYNNKCMLFLFRICNNYQKMPKLWAISLFPFLIIIQLFLVLFGQRPDSLIRVFLETSSFNYSNIPAPKTEIVPGDGHYLCTVSAKGHKKWVKPVRAGIRAGARIPVNRQLLIANAFENILEQYVPNFHKAIRNFYDKYGYPISRHVNSKWSADIIYLIMKPLEWLFLVVLYTVDKKPENRIHIQYSELRR
ncbi:DUF6688 domain-containing protein [Bacillus toyonensis]|uniref:DUF6688 domain-containing protein n=1 Tax=Bacillus toyonensis TaxID=155322 RepID=UPI000BF0C483|nr:DUF6688 family protein [Bacillus toyonensis]PEL40317.1 hypothetical protein CN638_30900 [Bacillus toyonensis]